MGEIGWAFIGGKAPGGTRGSVQYNDGDAWITGSNNFKYIQETNTVVVSSSVFVSGTLYANDYHVNVVNETITNISSNGSTIFGNTADDTHQFTGSVSINGNFELLGSPDSDLIYELSGTYYSASNGNVPHEATFDRAISPALIVSGAAVFNNPVSIQGGLYGASPIQVYAPLSFASVNNPNLFHSMEPGRIIGDIQVETDGTNGGLRLIGDSGISFESDFNNSFANYKTLQNVTIEEHPNMSSRQAVILESDLAKVQTKVPILTGSNQETLDDYSLEDIITSRITSTTDLRKNSYVMSFDVLETNFDQNYESHEATNDPSLQDPATTVPFTTSDFDDLTSTTSIMKVGSFGDVGEANKWNVRKGIKVAGNLSPLSQDSMETSHLSIGQPTARWGDLYLSNDRKISWGANVDNTQWFLNSQEQHSASFGYDTLTNSVVLDGTRLKLNNNLELNSDGYINFNQIQGQDGYGFRDYNGQIQFKNQTGAWSDFQSIFGGSSGASGSIQLTDGSGNFVSSPNLVFENNTLIVSGTIIADEIKVNTINETITNISMSGSTQFGDTDDDTHDFIGQMSISGSLSLKRKVITSNYTIQSTDHFIGVDSAMNITLQLPLASELNDGQFFTIKDENGGVNKQIILQCSGSDQIDGETAISLTSPYTAINLYTNGQNKFFIF